MNIKESGSLIPPLTLLPESSHWGLLARSITGPFVLPGFSIRAGPQGELIGLASQHFILICFYHHPIYFYPTAGAWHAVEHCTKQIRETGPWPRWQKAATAFGAVSRMSCLARRFMMLPGPCMVLPPALPPPPPLTLPTSPGLFQRSPSGVQCKTIAHGGSTGDNNLK